MQPSQSLNPAEAKKLEISEFINTGREKEFNAALEEVVKSSHGRIVIAQLFREFFLYATPHTAHGATTSFQCGEQEVCFRIRNWMRNAGLWLEYGPLIEKDAAERNQRWEEVEQGMMDQAVGKKTAS